MNDTPTSTGWFGRMLGRDAAEAGETHNMAAQKRMMNAAEEFHQLRVQDVMVPRADIIAIDSTIGLHDLANAFKDAAHSRLPVFQETLDNPLGMVHIKDLLPYLMLDAKGRNGKTYSSKKVVQYIRRPVLFVPPSMLAQDLLRRMQARRIHIGDCRR